MKKFHIAILISGIAAGSMALYFVLKKKKTDTDTLINDEKTTDLEATNKSIEDSFKEFDNAIESVKTVANRAVEKAGANLHKPDLFDYAVKLAEEGYIKYDTTLNSISDKSDAANSYYENENEEVKSEYYVISPEEFGEREDYYKISLMYFEDGVLTDEDFEVLSDEDITKTIGLDFANHFGEYEDDSVFIRNDRLKRDYEILKDPRSFDIITGKRLDPRLYS